ncbi:hypothetical protein GC098_20295 [Paenibacillus sp. LMG 31458]|uniref:PDZ domain-containing protein n=1 Tax=Paenibacillus phytorum TaxID=2654977 RepID=A0ABX1XYT5_9BACL|nr:hypothetical protein [Paenibacillus phytorum]NOU73732.1 hypothetical protein [Paenibacillus phytorum]
MSNNLNHLSVFIKKILSVIFLCLVLTACTAPKQLQPPTIKITPSVQPKPTKESTIIKPEKENIVPVEYMPVTLPTISLSPIGTNVVNKKLKEVKLQDASVVLYSKKSGESQNIYAGIKTGDKIYEIEGIIGYGNPDETEISQNYFNGISLIKIRGSEGVSAPITHYIKIENGFPISFIQLEKYCQEYDIDSDGKKELITSAGGTIPETEIIKLNGNKFESVNLNQVMNGVVTFDNKQLEFIVYQPNKNPGLYKMTSRGMEYVSEQS